MNTLERALMALYSVFIIIVAVCIVAISIQPYFFKLASNYIASDAGKIVTIVIGLLLLILGFKTLVDSFSRKKPTLASIQTTDLGTVNITITALEHLVSKAAKQVKEVKEIKPNVKPLPDGIAIHLNASVSTESNLPFVTRELQDTVKGYIEQIAGINVLEVKVLVNYISQETKLRVE